MKNPAEPLIYWFDGIIFLQLINLKSLTKTPKKMYNKNIERRRRNEMEKIEKALQIAANVITILAGVVTIIAFLKG